MKSMMKSKRELARMEKTLGREVAQAIPLYISQIEQGEEPDQLESVGEAVIRLAFHKAVRAALKNPQATGLNYSVCVEVTPLGVSANQEAA